MPKGTVYAKIPEKWIVNELCVKYESIGNIDWYYMSFDWVDADDSMEAIERLEGMAANSSISYPVQQSIARDSLYENDCLFLVYEYDDIAFITNELESGV